MNLRICSVISLLLALAFLPPANAPGQVLDRIVAVVNSDIITYTELQDAGRRLYEQLHRSSNSPAQIAEKMASAQKEVLDDLIEGKLMEQEMKKRKIEVSERDVDATVEDILKQNKITENDLKTILAKDGMTYSVYRDQVRSNVGRMRLVNREIKAKIVIKEEDVKKYYDAHLPEFTDPLEIKVQQIFIPVPPKANEERVAVLRQEAATLRERARKGEDFGQLARKYSQGPEANDDGVLGFFKHGELLPALEGAALKLKPEEVSDLVNTSEGIHILRVMEQKGGVPRPLAEIKEKLRSDLMQTESEKLFKEWIKSLKSKAYIETRL